MTTNPSRLGAMSLALMLAVSAADAGAAGSSFGPGPGTGRLIEVRTSRCGDCGTVVGIRPVRVKAESGSGAGAVVGAIAGGVLGHQLGGGRGRDIATAGGAIAGGLAGNSIEKNVRGARVYDVTVRMDGGGTETARVDTVSTLRNGSRVHVNGNNIRRM